MSALGRIEPTCRTSAPGRLQLFHPTSKSRHLRLAFVSWNGSAESDLPIAQNGGPQAGVARAFVLTISPPNRPTLLDSYAYLKWRADPRDHAVR